MWCAAPAARRAAPAPRGCGMRRRWWRRRSSLASLEEREQAIGQRRQVAGTEREAQVAGAEPGSQVLGRVGEARHPRPGGGGVVVEHRVTERKGVECEKSV